MACRICVAAVWLGVVLGIPAWSPAANEKAAPGRVARLVDQLGSRKYSQRQAAARALGGLGTAALPALEKAAKSPDVEIRRRARDLARAIRRRAEVESLLAPTTVHLVYRDKPLAEAAADLAKKTGFWIDLEGDKAKWAGRKITLDTGKTTFWEAFDQFCRKAQLTERGLVLLTEKKADNMVRGPTWGANGQESFKKAARLRLVAGKTLALPTAYYRGVRIRALPPTIPLDDITRPKGTKVFVLEASLEPRTRLNKLIGLRVVRAVNEKGADVAASPQPVWLLGTSDSYNPYATSVPSYITRLEGGMDEGNFRRVPVEVKAAKRLKELRGVLVAEVQTPAKALLTVDNVLKAGGKTFDVKGGSLTVVEAKHKENGPASLTVSSETTFGGFFAAIQMGNGVIRIRRNPGGEWETAGVEPSQLRLLDGKGRAYRQASVQTLGTSFNGRGVTQKMSLTFEPPKGAGPPAKLVYHGVGTACVDIPFSLKDVPLPE
jgi:hypothetical protein